MEHAEKGTARAKLYAKIGNIYAWHLSNGEEALQYSQQAIAEIDNSETSLDAAQTYLEIAEILSWWLREMESSSLIHKAIRIAEEMDDREMLAWCYSSASWMYAFLGVPERLQEMLQKAKCYLPDLQHSDNLFLLARVNTLLGYAAGEETEKIEFYTRGIEYAEKSGFQALLPMAARTLGEIYQKSGELDKAIGVYQKGWRVCLATWSFCVLPHEWPVTYCIGQNLMNLYLERGSGSKVVEMFGELADATMALLTKPGVNPEVANSWRRIIFEALAIHLYWTSGETAAQVQVLWQVRLAQTDNQDERCFYHVQWMKYAWAESDTDNAKLQAQKALQLCEANGVRTTMLNQSDRVLMYLLLGDIKTATQHYLRSHMETYQGTAPALQPSVDYIKLESVDLFDGDSLSPVWEWIDPKADCAYKLLSPIYPAAGISPSGLQITVPANHDLWESYNLNAPRLLQTISGDFAIETKISDGEGGRKSGGLLVWKDEDNYIRFEMPSSSPWEGEVRFEANLKGNYVSPRSHGGWADAKILTLRLERQEHRFSAYCSINGENWLICGWVELPMDKPIQVGIHGLCPKYPATSTRFEYFKILRRG
ncbi:DUF1349 domain-containing protein [bacterium]|nr:DUF1349 domain-containing protein [bacterium]